jgi:YcaO-like protein with predicted kinase domain
MAVTTSLWRKLCADAAAPRYRFGTRRAAPPRETLERLRPLLRRAGITRLADVTGLDWIGVPVYQAIRPNSRGLSVAQGKGVTRAQARVSALMESLESLHAENIAQPTVHAPIASMARELDYDPEALLLCNPPPLNRNTVVEWIGATDLCTGASTWLPKQLCDLDLRLRGELGVPIFRRSSNGLAAGNTVAEALLHGLCEVIERDASWRSRLTRFMADQHVALSMIRSTVPARLVERFSRAGMATRIIDATGPVGLPTFEVLLGHPETPVLHYGAGCHPNRSTALARALTEAAQSRLADIAGSRDDINRRVYAPGSQHPAHAAHERPPLAPGRSFSAVPTVRGASFRQLVEDLASRVGQVAGMSPLAADLSRPDFRIPVVFVVAPGLTFDPDGHL